MPSSGSQSDISAHLVQNMRLILRIIWKRNRDRTLKFLAAMVLVRAHLHQPESHESFLLKGSEMSRSALCEARKAHTLKIKQKHFVSTRTGEGVKASHKMATVCPVTPSSIHSHCAVDGDDYDQRARRNISRTTHLLLFRVLKNFLAGPSGRAV